MSGDFFEMLRCPQTHQRLLPVTKKWITKVNKQIEAGELRTEAGEVVSKPLDDGLLTEDDQYLYPVRDGLANMFIADRIILSK